MKKSHTKFFLLMLLLLPAYFFASSFADQAADKQSNEASKDEAQQQLIPKYVHVYSTEGNFADAKEDLLDSIANNGLVVSYTSHAKTMLENTAAVSGVEKVVYNDAEIILFCKAGLSHELVAGNPHNIVLCPYSIAIYVLKNEPERVYLSFRTVQASDDNIKALTKPIEELLIKIIEEVI